MHTARAAILRGCGVAIAACIAMVAASVVAEPDLGQPLTADEIALIDISIAPDGVGLPVGGGTAKAGEEIYLRKCASCHGVDGQGKPADRLAGGIGSLASNKPVKTVGSFWPYATTLFDYVRRAMPLNDPMSLTSDEVYALTAYILSINGIVSNEQILDTVSLPLVRMPNRDGFVDRSDAR